MILLCSSLRMKTQDLVSDNLATVTLMSPYLSKGVAFGEPSRSPCVVTVVLDAAVGYCVPCIFFFAFVISFHLLALCILDASS